MRHAWVGRKRLQSAMEYLMTYGWAILAIAIVMVSLYSLGIFNAGSLQPTANPGACEVVRTAAQASLAGQCSSLVPKYVGRFNGQNSYILTPYVHVSSSTLTASAWVDLNSVGGNMGIVGQGRGGTDSWEFKTNGASYDFVVYTIKDYNFGTVTSGSYVFLTAVYSSGNVYLYVNGSQVMSYSGGPSVPISLPLYIGYAPSDGGAGPWYLNGTISNIQVYNTSLDNASVKALYLEGIGGTPIDPVHIVGWWPLNGNANDYSGNNDQGTQTNMIWDANWQSRYAAPTT
ncbi:MAG: hypothetical protein KGH69_03560 [Candidatus Micrarchaeota archaeon]|nr:hypothetical protein [Candidatus Micrarchaeota archaeon]